MSNNTMGDDPLADVVPEQQQDGQDENGESNSTGTETRTNGQSGGETEKKRMTMHLPEELTERIRNAVFWTPGLTISDLGTAALRRIMDELEEQENDGETFPDRNQELKGGRPVK